ncbi:MAG: hypothetical protein IMW98_08495 [Firmicutes bacterium]|nr:hypothetical protein [Bacillota bacterium]MBE3590844.1 hypothetical protein [Bacillota bacterium]
MAKRRNRRDVAIACIAAMQAYLRGETTADEMQRRVEEILGRRRAERNNPMTGVAAGDAA